MGDDGAFDDGPEEFGAFFEAEGFEAAANGVKEDVSGGFKLSLSQCLLWLSTMAWSSYSEV